MSYCRREGKDTILFATKKDHETPSTVKIPDPDYGPGLIFPDGSINWNCPCLGGMATGPCGVPFREAFHCFHYSTAQPKGSNCFSKFKEMQKCMFSYPNVYERSESEDFTMTDTTDGDKSNHIGTKHIEERKNDKMVVTNK